MCRHLRMLYQNRMCAAYCHLFAANFGRYVHILFFINCAFNFTPCTYTGETNEVVHQNTVSHPTDAAVMFLTELVGVERTLMGKMQQYPECPTLTPEEDLNYRAARRCHICMRFFTAFDREEGKICRDHCHRSGGYRYN